MVTKQDVDNILVQVNAILAQLDERLTKLEQAGSKPTQKKTPAKEPAEA
jgi:hypothetical protein